MQILWNNCVKAMRTQTELGLIIILNKPCFSMDLTLPTLPYGAEDWILTNSQDSRIQGAEITILRYSHGRIYSLRSQKKFRCTVGTEYYEYT